MKSASAGLLFVSCLLLIGCGGGGGSTFTSSSSNSSAGTGSGGSGSGGGTTGTGGTLLITTTTLPDGLTGQSYSANLATTGGNGTLHFSISPGSFLPLGLAVNPSTGAITGSVSGAVFGDVTFQVTDSSSPQQMAQRTVRMTFHWALSVITPTPSPTGHTNVPYRIPYYCNSSNGQVTWSVSTGQVPPGLNLSDLNSTQANLVGTPTQPGTYTFTVKVVDSSTPAQTATFPTTITVDNKLAVATPTLPIPFANESYSQTVTAANGTPPYHWSGQLPSFFHIDATTGTISGTTGQGNFSGSVTVTDSSSPAQSATQQYGWLILPRLGVNGGTLPNANVNTTYIDYLPGIGGQGNVAWSLVSGSFPPGLTLQSQYGILSGTPPQTGTYVFTMQLQDSSSPPQVAQGQFTLNVKPGVLTLQTSLPQRIPINVPFDGVQVVSGGTPPLNYRINGGSLPPGLTLDGSSGRITGTPTTAGYFPFDLNVSDSSSPPQGISNVLAIQVGPALGRNDVIARATPIVGNGGLASISPLIDPPDGSVIAPDTDYYRITGVGTGVIKVNVGGSNWGADSPVMDAVLELVDVNGARLNGCRQPWDTSNNFNSPCLNDDISPTSRDSQLEYKVPGTPDQKTDIYAHVLDWRGDARPDMTYYIGVQGAFTPIVFQTSGALPDVAANSSYYLGITANGGTGDMTGTITQGQLPPGIQMYGGTTFHNNDGTGTWSAVLSGGPTTAGTYTFTLSLSDHSVPVQTVSQQFTIHVYPAIQLGTISNLTAQVGQPTTYQATVSGGIPPYHWSVVGPPAVSIDHNGLITLLPTTAGPLSFSVWVQGTDTASGGTQWSMQNVNVTVNP